MRRLLLPALAFALAILPFSTPAHAQMARVVTGCGSTAPFPAPNPGGQSPLYVDINGNSCGGGGGGGSSAFLPTPSYAQIVALDAVNHSTAVPTGNDDVISNIDTTIAYCNFGASAGTAGATFPIPGGATFGFHNGGAYATIQCQSPNSTLNVTISGGTGSFSGGGGGGGGGSGGGGAIFPSGGSALSSNGLGNTDANALDVTPSGSGIAAWTAPTVCSGSPNGAQWYEQCKISTINSPIQMPLNIAQTDCSGTVAAGATSQPIITANPAIHGFTLANIDSTAGSGEPIWFSMQGTAAAANTAGSYPLSAPQPSTFAGYGSFTTPPGFGISHAVFLIAATTGHKFSCTYW